MGIKANEKSQGHLTKKFRQNTRFSAVLPPSWRIFVNNSSFILSPKLDFSYTQIKASRHPRNTAADRLRMR